VVRVPAKGHCERSLRKVTAYVLPDRSTSGASLGEELGLLIGHRKICPASVVLLSFSVLWVGADGVAVRWKCVSFGGQGLVHLCRGAASESAMYMCTVLRSDFVKDPPVKEVRGRNVTGVLLGETGLVIQDVYERNARLNNQIPRKLRYNNKKVWDRASEVGQLAHFQGSGTSRGNPRQGELMGDSAPSKLSGGGRSRTGFCKKVRALIG